MWFWVYTRYRTSCDNCLRPLRKGTRIAFSPASHSVVCFGCACESGIAEGCRESKGARAARERAAA
jgi:recombinational DNA repair protein (RecF pathway)